jgi:hypothetical protein
MLALAEGVSETLAAMFAPAEGVSETPEEAIPSFQGS